MGKWAEAVALREAFCGFGVQHQNIRNTRNDQNSGKCMYGSGALIFSLYELHPGERAVSSHRGRTPEMENRGVYGAGDSDMCGVEKQERT